MDEDHLILRTSIKPSIKEAALFRGTCLAGLGGIIILVGGFISKGVLTLWGVPLYLVGVGLIVVGLRPHRKLQLLENNPNEIYVDQNLMFTFRSKGKPVLSTSSRTFSKIEYMDQGDIYGLALWFAQPRIHHIFLYNDKMNIEDLQIPSRKKYGCDLFLPYFSKRACQALLEFIEAETQQSAQ